MPNYKIVASDLDGTLFSSNGELSSENMLAIDALAKKGVIFAPSSGRTLGDITPILTEHPSIRYIIYSNGAAVIDKLTGKRTQMCIPNSLVKKILEIIAPFELHLTVRHNGKAYIQAGIQTEENFTYYNVCKPHIEVVSDFATQVPSLASFSSTLDEVETIALFFHDEREHKKCHEQLLKLDGLHTVVSWYNCIEIFSSSAGKGNALKALSDMADVDISETIAVGDSDNDVSMIKAAGLGLAVSNASELLLPHADKVICSNDEHCINYILDHFIG